MVKLEADAEEKSIIFYDKGCKFCFAAVKMILCFLAVKDCVEVAASLLDDAAIACCMNGGPGLLWTLLVL